LLEQTFQNAEADSERRRLLSHHLAARRALFARSMSVSDYANALRCLQDEARLLGLYPAEDKKASTENHLTLIVNEVVIQSPAPRAIPDAESN
jgi:hypothetical protein